MVIAVVATVVVALLAVATVLILNRQSSDGQVAAPPVAVAPAATALRQPGRARQQRRRDAGDGAGDDPGGPGEGDARHDDQPRARRLPRGGHHRARRRPGAPIVIKGPETGTDREGRYRAVLYGTGRLVNIDHSWITLDGFTVDGQEQLGGVPFPTDVRTIDAWKASIQDRVEDSRLVYIGSAEESATSPGSRSATCSSTARAASACGCATTPTATRSRLGDPVLQDVRQGRRGGAG